MKQLPQRTNVTALTDNELILFDCLYNTGSWPRPLGRETFEERCNFDSHDLDDQELIETLNRLVESKHLQVERDDFGDLYHLTPYGGEAWEAERLPRWDRFVWENRYWSTPDNRRVRITSVSRDCRDQMWEIGQELEMYYYAGGAIEESIYYDVPLSRWKTFPVMYTLSAPVDMRLFSSCNWREYERVRAWWRTIRELRTLWVTLD